jgi:hypothetical protein
MFFIIIFLNIVFCEDCSSANISKAHEKISISVSFLQNTEEITLQQKTTLMDEIDLNIKYLNVCCELQAVEVLIEEMLTTPDTFVEDLRSIKEIDIKFISFTDVKWKTSGITTAVIAIVISLVVFYLYVSRNKIYLCMVMCGCCLRTPGFSKILIK